LRRARSALRVCVGDLVRRDAARTDHGEIGVIAVKKANRLDTKDSFLR